MGMGALTINAEAVERRRMPCGEIAVGTAAGRCVHQIETDFGGKRPGMFVQRRAGILPRRGARRPLPPPPPATPPPPAPPPTPTPAATSHPPPTTTLYLIYM